MFNNHGGVSIRTSENYVIINTIREDLFAEQPEEKNMKFENRYIVTQQRYMDWVMHPIKNSLKYIMKIVWIIMLVLMTSITVYQIVSAQMYFLFFSCLLVLFCGYRVFFRTTIIANKQFKQTVAMQGSAEWERVTTFSDDITVADGCSITEFDYSVITELVDYRGYLALGIGDGLNKSYLRLAKDGFGQNTDQEFLDFIKRAQGHIVIRTI